MENTRSTIPAVFDGSFRQPISTHTTRAVDWIDIVRYIFPSLFVPAYSCSACSTPNACTCSDTKDALLSLVTILQITLQPTINDEMISLMKK
jgi:hypothetical protein